MPTRPGTFVWYELTAADPAASAAFYKAVLGWNAGNAGLPGMDYTFMSAGDTRVAGIMPVPPGGAARWTGYLAVADVDAAAADVTRLGGTVHRSPADIPGVGRFSVVADPQGAVFALFRNSDAATDAPPAVPPDTPGHGGWNELHATGWAAAWPFYQALFGWTEQRAVDMGPHGTYHVFGPDGGDAIGGGMENLGGPARWLFYFNVSAIDAAVDRVRQAGGTVLNGPMEVPGGSLVAQCADPGGVAFALVGRVRTAAG